MRVDEKITVDGVMYKTVEIRMNGRLLGAFDHWKYEGSSPSLDVYPVKGQMICTDSVEEGIGYLIDEANRWHGDHGDQE